MGSTRQAGSVWDTGSGGSRKGGATGKLRGRKNLLFQWEKTWMGKGVGKRWERRKKSFRGKFVLFKCRAGHGFKKKKKNGKWRGEVQEKKSGGVCDNRDGNTTKRIIFCVGGVLALLLGVGGRGGRNGTSVTPIPSVLLSKDGVSHKRGKKLKKKLGRKSGKKGDRGNDFLETC